MFECKIFQLKSFHVITVFIGYTFIKNVLNFRLVKSVTESFSDRESFQDAVDFFDANQGKFVGSENAVKQALEHVRLNVTWRDKDIDAIKRFLESNEAIEL